MSVCCRTPFICLNQWILHLLCICCQLVVETVMMHLKRIRQHEDLWSVSLIMAKRHILVDPNQPSTSKQPKLAARTNWELCILYQTETSDESLQCPLRSTKKHIGSGYASLAEDLLRFKNLQHMPMNLQVERLDDGDGVEATLRTVAQEMSPKVQQENVWLAKPSRIIKRSAN